MVRISPAPPPEHFAHLKRTTCRSRGAAAPVVQLQAASPRAAPTQLRLSRRQRPACGVHRCFGSCAQCARVAQPMSYSHDYLIPVLTGMGHSTQCDTCITLRILPFMSFGIARRPSHMYMCSMHSSYPAPCPTVAAAPSPLAVSLCHGSPQCPHPRMPLASRGMSPRSPVCESGRKNKNKFSWSGFCQWMACSLVAGELACRVDWLRTRPTVGLVDGRCGARWGAPWGGVARSNSGDWLFELSRYRPWGAPPRPARPAPSVSITSLLRLIPSRCLSSQWQCSPLC